MLSIGSLWDAGVQPEDVEQPARAFSALFYRRPPCVSSQTHLREDEPHYAWYHATIFWVWNDSRACDTRARFFCLVVSFSNGQRFWTILRFTPTDTLAVVNADKFPILVGNSVLTFQPEFEPMLCGLGPSFKSHAPSPLLAPQKRKPNLKFDEKFSGRDFVLLLQQYVSQRRFTAQFFQSKSLKWLQVNVRQLSLKHCWQSCQGLLEFARLSKLDLTREARYIHHSRLFFSKAFRLRSLYEWLRIDKPSLMMQSFINSARAI